MCAATRLNFYRGSSARVLRAAALDRGAITRCRVHHVASTTNRRAKDSNSPTSNRKPSAATNSLTIGISILGKFMSEKTHQARSPRLATAPRIRRGTVHATGCGIVSLGFCMAGVFTMRQVSATCARVRGRVSGSGRGRSGGGEWGWLFVKAEFLDEPAQKDVAEDEADDERGPYNPRGEFRDGVHGRSGQRAEPGTGITRNCPPDAAIIATSPVSRSPRHNPAPSGARRNV